MVSCSVKNGPGLSGGWESPLAITSPLGRKKQDTFILCTETSGYIDHMAFQDKLNFRMNISCVSFIHDYRAKFFTAPFERWVSSFCRYLAIRYPLRSRELRTPCNAVVAMVVIWGLSLVFAGPYLSYYDLIDFENSNVCVPGWEEHNRKVLDTCTFVFGYVIPVLIVSLSYTRTIKYLWTAVDPLDGMSESKRAKRKVTKMIIIVTVLFCICWLPYHVVILCYLYGDFPFNQTTYAFRLLSHCMAYANSCLNPIVYALVSKHFRKGFKKVFSCILSKKGRNKVHVVHVANIVPGFEAGSTEVSQMNEENARQNENEMVNRPHAEPQDATMTITLPFQNQPWK